MNNFITRTLSALVYAGVVIASLLVQPECFGNHMLLFGVVFMMVSTLAVREFHKLVGGSDVKIQSYAMMANALLFCTLYFFFYGDLVWRPLLFAYVAILMLTMILHLFREKVNAIQSWGNLCAGQLMIALPFALMSGIALYDKWLLFALFILIWVNDSGAYIVGSLMAKRKGGNHKMFPRVSPAKSWEGLVGGFIFDLIAGYIFYLVGWTSTIGLTAYPLLDSLLFALAVGIFGTLGDLMESLMKRTIGVKDSGTFMPGHGGVLDRFDSLLLAVPVVYFLFIYLPSVL
ncbi:MAG: phosphatidate cytidylyltransferase [Paludibacteraceae bacterium]|nr:phosphatidate cytidylyltransferase [Paludibacteraceae bacterium]